MGFFDAPISGRNLALRAAVFVASMSPQFRLPGTGSSLQDLLGSSLLRSHVLGSGGRLPMASQESDAREVVRDLLERIGPDRGLCRARHKARFSKIRSMVRH